MRIFILVLFFIVTACKPIQYKEAVDITFPELGTLGIYITYMLGTDYQPKTTINLSEPIRLQKEEISIQKRRVFIKKDSLQSPLRDSTLINFEILDKIGLITQLNADKDLMKYLRKNESYKLVSHVTVHFPSTILMEIKSSDEIYLTQNKTKTLSLTLFKDNKAYQQVEFSSGKIVRFKTSEFCWGLNRRREPEIFDLIPDGTECGSNTYKTANKVEKKNEFKF